MGAVSAAPPPLIKPPPDGGAAARQAAYQEALRTWNRLDCSNRARINIPGDTVEAEDVFHL